MKHLRARRDEAISCSGRISSSLVVGLNTTTGRVRSAAREHFLYGYIEFLLGN